jgi:hypothetical protein
MTLSVSSIEELESKYRKFNITIKIGLILYNLLNVVKIVLTAFYDIKIARNEMSLSLCWAVEIKNMLYVVFDLAMYVYFLKVTCMFASTLYSGPMVSCWYKFKMYCYMVVMSIFIVLRITKKGYTHSLKLAAYYGRGFILDKNCHLVTPDDDSDNFSWHYFIDILLFYSKYLSPFLVGFFIIAVFYLFT